jgi:hypothetical protein
VTFVTVPFGKATYNQRIRHGQEGRMPLSPNYLATRARRYRHLAIKAQAMAESTPDDPVSPRLRELAEKLTLDAERDEQQAQALLSDETGSPG